MISNFLVKNILNIAIYWCITRYCMTVFIMVYIFLRIYSYVLNNDKINQRSIEKKVRNLVFHNRIIKMLSRQEITNYLNAFKNLKILQRAVKILRNYY